MVLDIMLLVIGCQLRLKEVPPSIYGDATYGQLEFCQLILSARSCTYGSEVAADFESGSDFESSMTVCQLTFVH